MKAVINHFPKISGLSDFPTWDCYKTEIKGEITRLPCEENQLLDYVVKKLLKNRKLWQDDDANADQKRTLKYLKKMAKSIEIEKGSCLLSMFAYHYSKIGKEIQTEIVDDIDIPEYVDAPANSNYNLNYLNKSERLVCDLRTNDIIGNGVPGKRVFSVEHKSRKDEPTILCSCCHQSGVIICPECGGTGRERYEDGNYASGETRYRTIACHECGGKGKIPCPECNGSGQIDVYAANYSVVKSVKETNSIHVVAKYSVPWEKGNNIYESPIELYKDSWLDVDCSWDILKDINKEGVTSFLQKNRKEYIEDNRENIINEISELGLTDLYKGNEAQNQIELSELEKNRGTVYCRKEANYVFPVMLLNVDCGDGNKEQFFIYEDNGNTIICAMNVGYTSFGDVLKMKIKGLFK